MYDYGLIIIPSVISYTYRMKLHRVGENPSLPTKLTIIAIGLMAAILWFMLFSGLKYS